MAHTCDDHCQKLEAVTPTSVTPCLIKLINRGEIVLERAITRGNGIVRVWAGNVTLVADTHM